MAPASVRSVPQAPSAPSRMTLASLVKGRQERPIRVVLYGEAGIGKSTFAAEAPKPIFIGAEDGTAHLDVTRFPAPTEWKDVLDAVRTVETESHDFKTLVFDTLDWMEPILWASICKRDNMASIEEYGFGKGYVAALDGWREWLAAIERVYSRRGMNVILLAHSHVKTFKNPEGADFDRYEMKVHPKAGALVREWSDATLFARFETFAKHADDDKKKIRKAKGISTDRRLVHSVQTAAYDAKNRYSLPDEMPLDWATFEAATKAREVAPPVDLRAEIERKTELLDEAKRARVTGWLAAAGDDAIKLSKLNDWCNAYVPAGE